MTTEERIAQIAQGFGQGIQNYQQQQNMQRTQQLQDEARRRQEAIQALEVANTLGSQSGRMVDASQLQPLLASGDLTGIGDILQSAPVNERFKAEQDRLSRAQQLQDLQAQKLQQDMRQSSLPFEQTREGQKLAFEASLKGEKKEKVSPDMRKAATFALRIGEAEDAFKALSDKGFNPANLGTAAASALPNFLKRPEQKSQDQAERNFINALLRRESGAAIAPSEFESAEIQYFPRAGDDEKVLAQKARNRATALAGLRAEAGDIALNEAAQERQRLLAGNSQGSQATQQPQQRITDRNNPALMNAVNRGAMGLVNDVASPSVANDAQVILSPERTQFRQSRLQELRQKAGMR